jgi:hypothetical protein
VVGRAIDEGTNSAAQRARSLLIRAVGRIFLTVPRQTETWIDESGKIDLACLRIVGEEGVERVLEMPMQSV